MSLEPIRVLVVDDEPIAREGLSQLVQRDSELRIVGACEDGDSAVHAIQQLRPDLVILDVQMPELDGFGVIRAVGTSEMPSVIFVTAYDEYAVKAFEVAALDYLLKPFEDERLAEALRRAKGKVRGGQDQSLEHKLQQVLTGVVTQPREEAEPEYVQRLAIRETNRIVFIPVREIDWIQGADYYARLHLGGRSYLIRETMSSLSRRLDPARFFRTHRSAIVNLDRVREIQHTPRGDGVVLLQTGAKVRLAKGRRGLLTAAMARPRQ